MNIAIIFAGGVGKRMGSDGVPKQFLRVNGAPIIVHTLRVFQNHDDIDKIYIAMVESHIAKMQRLVKLYDLTKVCAIVPGGETGQDSIYKVLTKAAEENPGDSIALIHDGVRPILTDRVIRNNIEGVSKFGSAITCIPSTETIVVSHDGITPVNIPPRKDLYKAQAPQSFYLQDIIAAHNQVRNTPEGYDDLVDSCSIYFKLNKPLHFVEGNFGNLKVTTPNDVYVIEGLLKYLDAVQAFGVDE